jgi:N-acetylglucosaminyldiphosphoundecaprenol N-acetyl-beta-D-mannosaminyltransferase
VVPSAPVLVGIDKDLALRAGVLGADLAITDSGLMVLMWWLLKREKLERVSGLEYLKLLLEKLRPETGDLRPEISDAEISSLSTSGLRSQVSGLSANSGVSHAAAGGVFWVMPTLAARDQNLAWLRSQGFTTTVDDCYVAPMYAADGPLSDDALLSVIREKRPAHIILALGGGVQERLGWFLKQELENQSGVSAVAKPMADSSSRIATGEQELASYSQASHESSGLRSQVSGFSGAYRPGIHCIGAAIGFLSGEQVRIPMWVDYLYLGWLWRSVSAPTKFVPRYWKATRLVWLMIRYGAKAPVAEG